MACVGGELIYYSQMEEESEEAIGLAVALERIVAFSKSVCIQLGMLHRIS